VSQTYTTNDLKELFAYPFQDPEWKKKFLIGSLIVIGGYIVPIIPFVIIYGYIAQIMRRIIVEKGEPFLPEWDDWGKLLTDGFKLLGAMFVYMLPLFVVLFGGYIIFFVVFVFSASAGAEVSRSGGEMPLIALLVPLVGGVGLSVLYGLVLLVALAIGLVLPAIMGHVIATDEFAAAFRVREWWAIFRANLGGFLIAYVILLAISSALNFVFVFIYLTVILCCLLPFLLGPLTMYIMAIYSVVFAEAYREGVEKLESQTAAVESV